VRNISVGHGPGWHVPGINNGHTDSGHPDSIGQQKMRDKVKEYLLAHETPTQPQTTCIDSDRALAKTWADDNRFTTPIQYNWMIWYRQIQRLGLRGGRESVRLPRRKNATGAWDGWLVRLTSEASAHRRLHHR
jgi:hypothetical protein